MSLTARGYLTLINRLNEEKEEKEEKKENHKNIYINFTDRIPLHELMTHVTFTISTGGMKSSFFCLSLSSYHTIDYMFEMERDFSTYTHTHTHKHMKR